VAAELCCPPPAGECTPAGALPRRRPHPPPPALGPVAPQADAQQQAAGTEEFASVLAAVVDPLVEACERSAEALSADVPTRVDEVRAAARCACGCSN
jgi:hypothetical protein